MSRGGNSDLVLKASAVTRRFGGLVAVNKVDFEIPRGMIAAIIGPNGAGKTTLFNVIAGIYAPTEGHVELNGKRLISPPAGAHRAIVARGRAMRRRPPAPTESRFSCSRQSFR